MRLYRWMVDGEGRGFVQVEDDERLLTDVIGPFGHGGGWYKTAQRILAKELGRKAPGCLAALFAIEVLLPASPGYKMTRAEVVEWMEGKSARMGRTRRQMVGNG
jgi:hypothetical protein